MPRSIPSSIFDDSSIRATETTVKTATEVANKAFTLRSSSQNEQTESYSLASLSPQQSIQLLEEDEVMAKYVDSSFDKRTYTSFSGVDTKITISFKNGTPITVGEAQTVTYSVFRPVTPVYNLGSAKPAGYVRGERTIAGSIIFTVFDRHVLLNAFYNAYAQSGAECVDNEYLTDELPPFDIHMTFLNEYGQQAYLIIHDVYITTEGQVMSIEDMITENTMQYLATDITLMRPVERN